MTDATMAPAALAEKGADIDVLRQMVQFAAQRLMELETEALGGAGYDEKSAERLNSRNGFRERPWETRAGTVALKIRSCVRAATTRPSWSSSTSEYLDEGKSRSRAL